MERARAWRVVITGGASGIGRATGLLLARQGASVLALDVDADAGAALEAEATADQGPGAGRLAFRRTDVSQEDDVRDAVAEARDALGGLDALVCTAGIMRGQGQAVGSFEAATWDLVMDVNLRGTFLAVKHASGPMMEQGAGVIVLVSSKAGVSTGSGSLAYGASKGGVHGLALTLERHLGPSGIRINEVCPGDVDTPLYRRSLQEALANGADPAWVEGQLARATTPGSIAQLIAFLVSDAAAAVRGAIFTA
jgi:NAD(P)-dependent dehydrogenase (short-subunit alcohol dehydrogenase family)